MHRQRRGLTPKQTRIIDQCIKQWEKNPTRHFELTGYSLRIVPPQLRALTEIVELDLSNNSIRELPKWISELKNLQILKLPNNNLESLPVELSTLPLVTLDVRYSSMLSLPESVLANKNAKEVLRYYFESRDGKGSPLQELKLLVVGRGKAGKTTIIKRLAGEEVNENETETHSISIRELPIECTAGTVQTRVWDFGGQEILHSTHQFFLSERSLYLLVLEPRTGLAQRDAEYWLKVIETHGNGSPVIIVLNWSYGRTWSVDEVRLRRKYPFIKDFVRTDALSGMGIDVLQTSISLTVSNMMEVWLPFPLRWREIKGAVSGMQVNYLTFSEYAEICNGLGELDLEAQTDLAGILHALGLALYFGNDPRLHDTRVLNPSWVTGGVYAVIRSPFVSEQHGRLTVNDMSRILREAEMRGFIDSSDYPTDSHAFILELMRAFQLCYSSEGGSVKQVRIDEQGQLSENNYKEELVGTNFLVPELLPEFEPELALDWDSAPVRLRYRYEVLPSALLARFIVRTHTLSEGEPHWRHGVVLRHSSATALIRAEPDRNELQIFVLGDDEAVRQILVAIVRSELLAVHIESRIQAVEDLEIAADPSSWIGVVALEEIERPDNPIQMLPVQPQGALEVNVTEQLNKLVPVETRENSRLHEPLQPVQLFVCYAREDERLLKRLDLVLAVLEDQSGLVPWRDQRLIAGSEWEGEISTRLNEMDIFLFIASQTSLVRPYIREVEVRRALERSRLGEVEFLTVLLEPCAYEHVREISKFQRLASSYKSIAEAPLRSAAWEEVRKDLVTVIDRIRSRKEREHLSARY